MNKVLIWISILLWCILIVENMVIWTTSYIIIWYWKTWTLAIVSIFIWAMLWFWLKWLLVEKWWNDYDDDENWVNF